MAIYYGLFRSGQREPVGNKLYKSKEDALVEMKEANKQFREYNQMLKKKGIDKKPIKMVRVREYRTTRRKNVFG